MTNPPFRTEVLQIRRWCGNPIQILAASDELDATPESTGPRRSREVEVVVGQLEPIRSRSSLLASFAREASPSEPVRTAYAIRWVELGSGIAATGIARSRSRRAFRP